MKQIFIVFLFFISFIARAQDKGYKIKIHFSNVKDTTVALAHYFADKHYVDDAKKVDKKGNVVFEGEKPLHGGLYLVIVSNTNYFELIIGDKQNFSIEVDTSRIIESIKFTGSIENKLFYDSQLFLKSKHKTISELTKKQQDSLTHPDTLKIVEQKLAAIDKELSDGWRKIVKDNPNIFYAKMLNAMNGEEGAFFDNVDFSDPRLLYSKIIYTTTRRVMARDLNGKKSADEVIVNSDKLIEKAKANDEVFQYVFTHLLSFYNTFARLDFNRVFVHLAEKYVKSGETKWFDSTAVAQILKRSDDFSASFPGKIAKDIKVETIAGDSINLHSIKAKYTILFFWNTGCGHCKAAAEKMTELYKEDLDVAVFAVYTGESKSDWQQFINENKTDKFINTWDVKMNSNYQTYYYVVSTPVSFLLDKDKKILVQKNGDTPIIDMVNQLLEQKDKLKK